MKFSDIRESIAQIWEFFLPPLLNISIMLGIFLFLYPDFLSRIFSQNIVATNLIVVDSQIKDTLEFYGINSLIPLVVIFMTIFLIYIFQALISLIGNLIPGRLVYIEPKKLINIDSDYRRLSRLWSQYPDAETFSQFINIFYQKIRDCAENLKHNLTYWEKEFGKQYGYFNNLKVYELWAVIVIILSGNSISSRFFLVLFGLIIVHSIIFAKLIYIQEQQAFATIDVMEVICFGENVNKEDPFDELLKKYKDKIIDYLQGDNKWWRFQLIDPYQFKWFYEAFISKRRQREVKEYYERFRKDRGH